jgi:hypothetical protein
MSSLDSFFGVQFVRLMMLRFNPCRWKLADPADLPTHGPLSLTARYQFYAGRASARRNIRTEILSFAIVRIVASPKIVYVSLGSPRISDFLSKGFCGAWIEIQSTASPVWIC